MLKRLLIFAAVFVALSLYWWRSYEAGFFGLDELNVISDFKRASDPGEVVGQIFAPHNRHFIPLFKAIFLLEYRLFGLRPAPYHAVSVALYAVNAVLFFRFLHKETGDRLTAFLMAAVLSANTLYFSVITWVFIQPFILTLMFLQLALLALQSSWSRLRGPALAGACSVAASFCLAIGAASWLFASAYYLSRRWVQPPSEKPKCKAAAMGLALLAGSALVTIAAYLMAGRRFIEEVAGSLTFDAAFVARGTVALLGGSILKTLGLYPETKVRAPFNALAEHFGSFSTVTFVLAIVVAALLVSKLRGARLASALTGTALALGSSTIVAAASLKHLGITPDEIIKTDRYAYIPFYFLLIAAAPLAASAGRRAKLAVLCLALPGWLLVHSLIYSDILKMNKFRIASIKKTLAAVELAASHNYPVVKKGMGFSVVDAPMERPRPLPDMSFFHEERPSYKDLLHIFKGPGDLVVERPGEVLFLRRYITVPPSTLEVMPEGALRSIGKRLKLSGSSAIKVSATGLAAPAPSEFMHLSFRLRADVSSEVALICNSPVGGVKETLFEVRGSLFHKLYVLPCPYAADFSLLLKAGDYSVGDIRLHY